ncbi:MAG: ribonuclease D [Leptospirillia bacterium]
MTAEAAAYILIEDTPTLSRFVEDLKRCPELAVDIEANSLHHYTERVSLIQLTGREADGSLHHAILDPFSGADVQLLAPLMADPEVVIMFHGADYDVVSLKRDYGFTFTNLFDTMIAARAAGMERFGLADLVNGFFGVTLNKKYQKYNWGARPLSKEALDYAHLDTRYLPEIVDLIMPKVVENGRADMLEEECRLLEKREWVGRVPGPDGYLQMKGAAKLPENAQRVLRELYGLREKIAEKRDLPTFKVLGNDLLLTLARKAPKNAQALEAVAGRTNRSVRRYGPEILDAVAAGLVSTEPLPTRKPAKGRRFTREDDQLFRVLRDWRNKHAKKEGVEPALVVNNHVLQESAATRPTSVGEMAGVDGVRQWQLNRYGEDIVAVINQFQSDGGSG